MGTKGEGAMSSEMWERNPPTSSQQSIYPIPLLKIKTSALSSYSHVKVSIRGLSLISTTAPIFKQFHYFRHNIWVNIDFRYNINIQVQFHFQWTVKHPSKITMYDTPSAREAFEIDNLRIHRKQHMSHWTRRVANTLKYGSKKNFLQK